MLGMGLLWVWDSMGCVLSVGGGVGCVRLYVVRTVCTVQALHMLDYINLHCLEYGFFLQYLA
jgi:hypothetical protein